ncbi:hypothetical protein [Piscinibacter sp. HJYY11]|uniref:hypothetical protein n=1 Tax=Piscinibacter sp. HJYY11 TaxID=2801333 RepID=UPI00191DE310|nr:hypothetical protein [Piscinibacter sp. HJYY11]MBL0729043.1 hypothetical protein [Piscinibacter sp. HJYY11]
MASLLALTSGTALPAAIDNFMKRGASYGPPLPLKELNVHVPAAPMTLDNGGAYTITLYGGPALSFSVNAKPGRLLATA